jgi:hypothetical protein
LYTLCTLFALLEQWSTLWIRAFFASHDPAPRYGLPYKMDPADLFGTGLYKVYREWRKPMFDFLYDPAVVPLL